MAQFITRRSIVPLAMAVVLSALSGCGYGPNDRVPVQGKVQFDGVPVEDGVISFIPGEAGRATAGGPITNGRYSIQAEKGPNPGKYRVEILVRKKTGRKVDTPGDTGNKIDETVQLAPAKYNTNSTLTADIQAKANTIDFTDLKSQ